MTKLIPLLVAITVGIAVVTQAQISSLIERQFGLFHTVFITYVGGALIVLGFALVLSFGGHFHWNTYQNLPVYSILSGLCGLIIVGGIAYGVSRLGLVTTFGIILAIQFSLATLFDHYGIGGDRHPLDLSRILAILFLSIGATLFLK